MLPNNHAQRQRGVQLLMVRVVVFSFVPLQNKNTWFVRQFCVKGLMTRVVQATSFILFFQFFYLLYPRLENFVKKELLKRDSIGIRTSIITDKYVPQNNNVQQTISIADNYPTPKQRCINIDVSIFLY